jgi:hypothetical protein
VQVRTGALQQAGEGGVAGVDPALLLLRLPGADEGVETAHDLELLPRRDEELEFVEADAAPASQEMPLLLGV